MSLQPRTDYESHSWALLKACPQSLAHTSPSPQYPPVPEETALGAAATSSLGALLILLLATALPVWGVATTAPGLEAGLVGVASVLLPVLFFLALAFGGFLAALFLLRVLLFMGWQRVLDCVNQKSLICTSERTLHPGEEKERTFSNRIICSRAAPTGHGFLPKNSVSTESSF